MVVIEGFHALKHALRFGADVQEVLSPDPAAVHRLAAELAPDVLPALAVLRQIPLEEYACLAPHPPPTGIIALARRPALVIASLLKSTNPAPLVLLEQPVHLGNLGAAVRVAAATDAAGLLSIGHHDPWSPEAVRGGAGLQFALPVSRIDSLLATDRPLVAVAPGGEPLTGCALPTGCIVAFGSERTGLSEDLLSRSARVVSIPMREGVSSLNLATAVAVVMYQRLLG